MKPAIVLPLHDPSGIDLPHLLRVDAELKTLFEQAFIGVSAATREQQAGSIHHLEQDPYYTLTYHPAGSQPGDHLRRIYQAAAESSPAGQPLHLCNPDRVAFALQGGYRKAFIQDVLWASEQPVPVLFQRSDYAWSTHPDNYRRCEWLVIEAAQMAFGRYYDFVSPHLVVRPRELLEALEQAQSRDFGIMTELVLLMRERLETRDVDWLAWEDPFILGRDPAALKAEREASRVETVKRLKASLPCFQHLLRLSPELGGELKWEK